MGNTQSAGTNHNKYWNIGGKLGNKFEDIIFESLKKALNEHLYEDVKIMQTGRTNDKGKDIIIEFECKTLNLFEIAFSKGSNKKAVIYIECKSSNSNQTLRREKFMTSIERGSALKIDYYILLTNSKIMACDYYNVENELSSKGIQFILIDQYLLARFLRKNNCGYFKDIPLYGGDDEYYVEYQVFQNETNDKIYDIYFLFRNYSQTSQLYTISMVTNVNWNTNDENFSFTIDSNRAQSKKVSLKCDYENDYKPLLFKVESGKKESVVEIKGIDFEECYIPPLTGKNHNKILDDMYKNITGKNPNSLFCLWGEAGIGKSRIASELKGRLKGGHYDIFDCELSRRNDTTIKKISKFLSERGYLSSNLSTNNETNLYYTVSNSKTTLKSALIFIDDFHNSNEKLIEQVKQLQSLSTPVILVLCGRTDYSAGNTSYYSFVQWTYEHIMSKKSVWNVKPLTSKETRYLIQSMIKSIPNEALDTICKLSDNNPLYIVQFVEYLLDDKIARVINRDCIGIIEPAKFKSHNYLPNDIADIYKKRITHLNKISNKYMKFLYSLAVYGGQLSYYIVQKFLDPDGTIIPFLYSKKFITKKNNIIIFFHESLKIYVQNLLISTDSDKKKIANYILQLQEGARKDLSIYTIGRLYLWNGDEDKALDIFKPIIKEIKSIKNISNINIDLSLYEYFDDILQICKEKAKYNEVVEKAIEGSVYVKLHYFVPINAAKECDKYIEYMENSPKQNNYKLKYSLITQKAHALLNCGMNMKGEFVLKELQSKWMIESKKFDQNTVFDMLDRLCAVYVKFNCYDLACDYSKLELDAASEANDLALSMIAYRTRSKLYYLNNPSECKNSLNQVDLLLKESPSPRIELNNNIYHAIVDLTYNTKNNYDEIVERLEEYSQLADDQNMNRADIQSNMALAAAYLKRGNSQDLMTELTRTDKAIGRSIRYGIPSYMWQLYNLRAIIDAKLCKDTNVIKQDFENCLEILKRQNLLFIGKTDLCYSNILAISNIGFYFQKYSYQKTFNLKMSQITYCTYTTDDINHSNMINNTHLSKSELIHIYEKASKKEILFSDGNSSLLLRDDETKYFIALT